MSTASTIQSKLYEINEITASIRKLSINFKKDGQDRKNEGYYKYKKEVLNKYYDEFRKLNSELVTMTSEEDRYELDYFKNNYKDSVEDNYDSLSIALEEGIVSFEPEPMAPIVHFPENTNISMTNNARDQKKEIRLAPIDIQKFNGSYHKWITFRSLFSTLIDENDEFSEIQKFHYLKSFLVEEPSRLINQLTITEENYKIAWNTLERRYQNTRVLVNTQLDMLLSQENITTNNSVHGIRKLLDISNEAVQALATLKVNTSSWDPIIIFILVQKLDFQTHTMWENSLSLPKELPTLTMFFDFLETRFHTLENLNSKCHKPHPEFQKNKNPFSSSNIDNNNYPPSKNYNRNSRSFNSRITEICPICSNDHQIYYCPKFKDSSVQERIALVRSHSLCFKCLYPHRTLDCTRSNGCSMCGKPHNNLLHIDHSQNQQNKSNSHHSINNFPSEDQTETATYSNHVAYNTNVLLATALITLTSKSGHLFVARCLLDQGSQSSFITAEFAQKLQLPKKRVLAQIAGLGTITKTSNEIMQVQIKSRYNNGFQLTIEALILPRITNALPSSTISVNNWDHIKGLQLADPEFNKPGKIDMLLGADAYGYILRSGLRKGVPGAPIAQDSELGWILSGHLEEQINKQVVSMVNIKHVEDQLKKFWEVEEGESKRYLTRDEDDCEQIFKSSHKRNIDGRFVVKLPFKYNPAALGKSRGQAVSRFLSVERKMQRDPKLREHYNAFIQEYINLHHMVLIDSNSRSPSYYMPHHAVYKPSSSSTKLRVVFDASAKTSTGKSLNDQMLVGATLQNNLASILLKWRIHKVAFTADIPKMYRQILVCPEDNDFQRIIFRFSPQDPIQDYKLTTVTYGTSSAPYLAIRSLRQLAIDEENDFPLASNATLNDFYVDDIMSGADSVAEVLVLQKQLKQMLQRGGFELKKWISNYPKVLEAVPEEEREVNLPLAIELEPNTKTLGVHYHPSNDTFRFVVCLDTINNTMPTKRSLLSETSKIFDPLGWLGPIIITAKIMFQELWSLNLTWDEKLPPNLAEKWLIFRNNLPLIEKCIIPRWLGKTKENKQLSLHGFCDASEKAYAAVIYSRIEHENGKIEIKIVTAKTKVAPIKALTLPRLELCGAVLLANIMQSTINILNVKKENIFAWCDSTIVLGWLKGNPTKYKTFVANRLIEIHDVFDENQWRHVKSQENPADCASRGIHPGDLFAHSLWWTGPPWLKNDFSKWTYRSEIESSNLELKKVTLSVQVIQNSFISDLLNKHSTLDRLLRQTAICFRFIKTLKDKMKNSKTITKSKITKRNNNQIRISVEELKDAMVWWIKRIQMEEFAEEFKNLSENTPIHANSKLVSFNMFLDGDAVMRIGGRITNAPSLSFEQKHQVILPYSNHLTNLIILEAHKKTQHGGNQITSTYLRQTYWIIKMRNAVKRIINKCVLCFRYNATTKTQLMGDLPRHRLEVTRTFTNTGVDYAGPINLKLNKGRGHKCQKGYIAVFVCLSTKAMHLEVVTELTANSFLDAFERFTARRGLCANIFSDNGTNFVAANKVLKNNFENQIHWLNKTVHNKLANLGIQWHFNPPAAPHFGGLWEAGVKSVKTHLRKILGITSLTYEEMSTVLCKIEACLNSRPLCSLTNDPTDLSALTPGHFLIGAPLLAPPQSDLSNININRLVRWRQIEKLTQDIWKRWSTEYLSRLQQRPKWATRKKDLKVDDLVILKNENMPPSMWALCRVHELHPGKDLLVRVVTLRTATGFLKRPISKLCALPISDNGYDN